MNRKGIQSKKPRRAKVPRPRARGRSWSERVTLTPEWAAWRKRVFERDGYHCVMCPKRAPGEKISWGVALEPHHIIRKIERPDLMHDVDNGVALCTAHHEGVTGQEAAYVVRFSAYVKRTNARAAALADMTGFADAADAAAESA